MSFKTWLYNQLCADAVISEDYVEEDEITKDFLMLETDLLEDDIETYRNEFIAHCQTLGEQPDWDLA